LPPGLQNAGKSSHRLVNQQIKYYVSKQAVWFQFDLSVGKQFKNTTRQLSKVEQTANLFENREFCVINASDADDGLYTKSALEIKIRQFGGRIVQHPSKLYWIF